MGPDQPFMRRAANAGREPIVLIFCGAANVRNRQQMRFTKLGHRVFKAK